MSALFPPDFVIANGMRRLNGEICTPPLFPKDVLKIIREHGLMRFHEWPSGHWALTNKGRNFLAAVVEEEE